MQKRALVYHVQDRASGNKPALPACFDWSSRHKITRETSCQKPVHSQTLPRFRIKHGKQQVLGEPYMTQAMLVRMKLRQMRRMDLVTR